MFPSAPPAAIRAPRSAGLAVLCALLAACGFHLAGSRPLPEALSTVYIDLVTPYQVAKPPLEAALRSRLSRRGADIMGSAGQARSVLRLTNLDERRRVVSVDRFGKAVEFELTASVRYELLGGGAPLVPADVLQVSRDYSFNAEQVLAKEAEEARMQAFLQDELAELLILRLEAGLRHAGP